MAHQIKLPSRGRSATKIQNSDLDQRTNHFTSYPIFRKLNRLHSWPQPRHSKHTFRRNKHVINPTDILDDFLMQISPFRIPRHFGLVNEKRRSWQECSPALCFCVATCLFAVARNGSIPVRLVRLMRQTPQ